jgi:hypothetical protein
MVLFRSFSSNDLYAELEKSSTYSHAWLGLNPQIRRPLSRIVVRLVYFWLEGFISINSIYFEKEIYPSTELLLKIINTINLPNVDESFLVLCTFENTDGIHDSLNNFLVVPSFLSYCLKHWLIKCFEQALIVY